MLLLFNTNNVFAAKKYTVKFYNYNGTSEYKNLRTQVYQNSYDMYTYSIVSLTGNSVTWTEDTINNRYYDKSSNIYIYPVDNVAEARLANGD